MKPLLCALVVVLVVVFVVVLSRPKGKPPWPQKIQPHQRHRVKLSVEDGRMLFIVNGQTFNVPRYPSFDVRRSEYVIAELLELLDQTQAAFAKMNIRWWLAGGGGLGWARNGALIPWDDDLDLHVHFDDFAKLLSSELRRELDPLIIAHHKGNGLFKVSAAARRFPFIDVLLKRPNGRNLWETVDVEPRDDNGYSPHHQLRWDVALRDELETVPEPAIFPLQPITLHGVPCYLPRDLQLAVTKQYGKNALTEVPSRAISHFHPLLEKFTTRVRT